jgi:peptidoglycan glycosyltransferase
MNQLPVDKPYAQRLLRVQIFFLVAFLAIVGALTAWSVWWSGELAAREDNPRLVEAELRIERGRILDTAERVLAQSLPTAEGRFNRDYPNDVGEPVIGYYSLRYGTAGIEASMDDILRGTAPDNWAQLWRDLSHQPQRGRDVRLTLRADLQADTNELLSSHQGAVVLLALNDNAVRVMASQPTYDPNLLDEQFDTLVAAENAPLLNRPTQGLYQPGLILAPFVIAGAVEDGLLNLNQPAPADVDAPIKINGEQLTCTTTLPEAPTWGDAFRANCPGAMIALADVGVDEARLRAYWDAFGLTTTPEIPLEVTEPGVTPIQDLSQALLGQDGLTISPLQTALALAVLARDGEFQDVSLISAVADELGVWQGLGRAGETSRQVVAPATADTVRAALPRFDRFIEYEAVALSGPDQQTTAWYIALAPVSSPRYALILVLEGQDNTAVARAMGRQLLEKVLE